MISRVGRGRRALTELLPLAAQLHDYSAHSLRGDLLAAATVAVTLVPQGLAYGAVAGLQPVTGLYTAVGAAALFSLVTSTRHIAVGPSATLAVLTFEAVRGPAGGDPGRAAMLAALHRRDRRLRRHRDGRPRRGGGRQRHRRPARSGGTHGHCP